MTCWQESYDDKKRGVKPALRRLAGLEPSDTGCPKTPPLYQLRLTTHTEWHHKNKNKCSPIPGKIQQETPYA